MSCVWSGPLPSCALSPPVRSRGDGGGCDRPAAPGKRRRAPEAAARSPALPPGARVFCPRARPAMNPLGGGGCSAVAVGRCRLRGSRLQGRRSPGPSGLPGWLWPRRRAGPARMTEAVPERTRWAGKGSGAGEGKGTLTSPARHSRGSRLHVPRPCHSLRLHQAAEGSRPRSGLRARGFASLFPPTRGPF